MKNKNRILRQVANEIIDRLIFRNPTVYTDMSRWSRYLAYRDITECVVRNRFKDLFEILYENNLIEYKSLSDFMDVVLNMSPHYFVGIVSNDLTLIDSKCAKELSYDICMDIYRAVEDDKGKVLLLINRLIYYVPYSNSIRSFIKEMIRRHGNEISKRLGFGIKYLACERSRLGIYTIAALFCNTNDSFKLMENFEYNVICNDPFHCYYKYIGLCYESI